MTRRPTRKPVLVPWLAAAAMLAAGLAGCVAVGAGAGPVTLASPMRPPQLADCVAHVFDSQIPLVDRRIDRHGARIVVRDMRDRPMVVVTIAAAPEGSMLRFVAERQADRRSYLGLLGSCVRLR